MVALSRLIALSIGIFMAISAWILGVRMRRRIKRALGVEVNDVELTSLNTWMKVEDAEDKTRGGKLQ